MKAKAKDLMVIQGGSFDSPPQAVLQLQAVPIDVTPAAPIEGPGGLEAWMPLFRSTDSASLLGESGVIRVGVNDLGWVVYDWMPGP